MHCGQIDNKIIVVNEIRKGHGRTVFLDMRGIFSFSFASLSDGLDYHHTFSRWRGNEALLVNKLDYESFSPSFSDFEHDDYIHTRLYLSSPNGHLL